MNKSEWKMVKLEEVCDTINGLWVGKKSPFINVGVIRNTNFTKECSLDYSDIVYLDVEEKQYKTKKLLVNDLIIERSGGSEKQPVGRVVLFNKTDGEYSFSNFTSCIRVKNINFLSPLYLYRFLQSVYLKGVTKRMQSNTTGIRNLDFSKYKEIQIPLFSLSKQKQIAAILDKASELVTLRKKQLEELDTLAESVFYDMFGDPVNN